MYVWRLVAVVRFLVPSTEIEPDHVSDRAAHEERADGYLVPDAHRAMLQRGGEHGKRRRKRRQALLVNAVLVSGTTRCTAIAVQT